MLYNCYNKYNTHNTSECLPVQVLQQLFVTISIVMKVERLLLLGDWSFELMLKKKNGMLVYIAVIKAKCKYTCT